MPHPLLLDSSILARVVRPDIQNKPLIEAMLHILRDSRFKLCVPEIVDYELRRKLLHVGFRRHQSRFPYLLHGHPAAHLAIFKNVDMPYIPLR